jgi:hypothetical protein
MGHRRLEAKPTPDGCRLPGSAPPRGGGRRRAARPTSHPRPAIRSPLGQLHRNRQLDLIRNQGSILIRDRVQDGAPTRFEQPRPPPDRPPRRATPGATTPAPGLRRKLSSPELICSKGLACPDSARAPLQVQVRRQRLPASWQPLAPRGRRLASAPRNPRGRGAGRHGARRMETGGLSWTHRALCACRGVALPEWGPGLFAQPACRCCLPVRSHPTTPRTEATRGSRGRRARQAA